MDETTRDTIMKKVETLLTKMHQNQQLQNLAIENGLDVKNSVRLTDDTIYNIATSVVALALAKQSNDPRYAKLVNTGLEKRSLKMEIINDYKSQANEMIDHYRSGNFNMSVEGGVNKPVY